MNVSTTPLAAPLHEQINAHLLHTVGVEPDRASPSDPMQATAQVARAQLSRRWVATQAQEREKKARRVVYLSMEFLMGRSLSNALAALNLTEGAAMGLAQHARQLEDIADQERDAALGNGGLGRLAACFLDSLATLELPAYGYGLRYEYGMFRQRLENGYQVEEPDHWLRDRFAWELVRPEYRQRVHFGGRTEFYRDDSGQLRSRWVDSHDVLAIPYDVPIPGYRNGTVNTLRLWKSVATEEFDLEEFNAGSYVEAVAAKNAAEQITLVLYPNDASESGKELRLRQQYFLASASLKDVLRCWKRVHGDGLAAFAEKNVCQLNDTHPTIAVAELMRLLIDEEHWDWDDAWAVTSRVMAYTNHTLLPEALERWPVRLFRQLLPRLLEIS